MTAYHIHHADCGQIVSSFPFEIKTVRVKQTSNTIQYNSPAMKSVLVKQNKQVSFISSFLVF